MGLGWRKGGRFSSPFLGGEVWFVVVVVSRPDVADVRLFYPTRKKYVRLQLTSGIEPREGQEADGTREGVVGKDVNGWHRTARGK